LLNGCFKPFIIANWTVCVLCCAISAHGTFGPWLCSTPQVNFEAH
jgi:hypothetical protein